MPFADSLFNDANKNKPAGQGSSSLVKTIKGTYNDNKDTINACAQAAVMVGVLRLAANYMQSK